ncbi:MAG: BatD family protein [Bacteroidales bacterium]|nr:BatD family protein [Bacteroidales bacterium]MCF8337349.1 BatD family protein [Bacteroidales bacterium]
MRRLAVIVFLISLFFPGFGQDDINFEAKTKTPVRVGERFRMTFNVNAEGENFMPPDFDNFKVLSGPNRSSRSSIQIVNGNVSRSVNYEYYYTLEATREGTFEIGPATIGVDGETYKSNRTKVRVVPGDKQSSRSRQKSSSQSSGRQSSSSTEDELAFLRAEVNKTKPYQGEEVIVTYKLYYRVDIADYGISQSPSYPGCWSQDLTNDSQRRGRTTETVDGKRYYVSDIYKEAIFPQRSGKIESKPMHFKMVARVKDRSQSRRKRDPFESFFDNQFGYKRVEKTLKSNPVNLDVKALPENNKPTSFSGAVGDFRFNTDIDKTDVKANDAVNLTLKVKGDGNIKLIDPPEIDFPPDFEVYDPDVSINVNASTSSGVSGSKTFEYTIIPRIPGEFTIEPLKFSYYDLQSNRYVTKKSPVYTINVSKTPTGQGNIAYNPSTQEEIQYLGKDIRFIYTKPYPLKKAGEYFYGSQRFYLLLIIPLVLFVVIVLLIRYNRKQRGNVALQKERKATRIARKHLKRSKKVMQEGNSGEFYEELADAVWGYISDKFHIPLSDLSMDTVRERLEQKNISAEMIQQFIDTLEECEYARFAPGEKDNRMEQIYHKAYKVIIQTEKQLK